ncbi:MAG: ABC transporter ATP-binding protein [Bacteroidales bacterium]|nr:ABC transporter ATP-binding protein [Candidatus Egerieousia equi]
MFTINNLTISYGSKNVLSELSFSAGPGMIHGIAGYNGAGKTTLLNAIYSVPHKFETIRLNGKVVSRSSVAYLESDQFFYPNISGRDFLNLFKSRNASFDYNHACSIFNVPIDKAVDSYSTGMKKKLAIIVTLSLNKELVLLDEPFNGLDLESVYILQMALKKLASKGKTIIVTSHIIESIVPICNTISILADGKIARTYLPKDYHSLTEDMRSNFEFEYCSAVESVFK